MKRTIIITTLLALATTVTLNSCKTAALIYYDKHPEKLADRYALQFPIQTDSATHDSASTVTTTEVRKGIVTPGVQIAFNCDSAQAAARAAGHAAGFSDGVYFVQCPPCPPTDTVCKTTTVSHYYTVTITKERSDALFALQTKYNKLADAGIKQGQKFYFAKQLNKYLIIVLAVWLILRFLRSYMSKVSWLGWLVKII